MFKMYQVVQVEDFTFDQSKEAFEKAVKDELFRAMEELRMAFSEEYDRRKTVKELRGAFSEEYDRRKTVKDAE